VLALEWPDLNLTTGELIVSKSLEQTKAGPRVKSTKSEKPRWFVVPETVLPVLADHRAEQDNDKRMFGPDYQDHGLIFCQPGGGYYSPDRLSARVKQLMVAVGLEGRQPPFAAPLERHRTAAPRRPNRGSRQTPRARGPEHHVIDLQPRRSRRQPRGGEGLGRRAG